MPHRPRPVTTLLLFTGLNVVLVSTISPAYDYVCFHPYWERRRTCNIYSLKLKCPFEKVLCRHSRVTFSSRPCSVICTKHDRPCNII